jgi:glycosyltransferase involved in cell wall biosynthesis
MMPFVSIICPVCNESKFIDGCINSIINQDYPKDQLEVLFVDGDSNDDTKEKVQFYAEKYSYIHLLDNPRRIVPTALNLGINASKGDVIIRLDGHCIYPINYVSLLVKYLFADNVGGVWNTLPAKDNSVCRAIALASSHKFGVGNSMHKTGSKEIIETDTVPFGCYRRDVFNKIGLFDEELIRNQDDEFNARLINNGGKIFLIPQLVINYSARDTVGKMSKMYYQYGLFKPLVNKKLGAPATVRQFFPAAFVLGLIGGGIVSSFSAILAIIYLSVLILYTILSFCFSIFCAYKWKDWKQAFILPIIFFIIHFSYGTGYWNGIFNILLQRKFKVSINR